MPAFLGKGSFFVNNVLAGILVVVVAVVCVSLCVCVSGEVDEMGVYFFPRVILTEKLLVSGSLLEEYFRNMSVHLGVHILSNKPTCKIALQQHLFKKKVAPGISSQTQVGLSEKKEIKKSFIF